MFLYVLPFSTIDYNKHVGGCIIKQIPLHEALTKGLLRGWGLCQVSYVSCPASEAVALTLSVLYSLLEGSLQPRLLGPRPERLTQ